MTAQISDEIHYRDKRYCLAGIKGGELFDPHEYGVTPASTISVCWRGFFCGYKIADGALWLDQVNLCGVSPRSFERAGTNGELKLLGKPLRRCSRDEPDAPQFFWMTGGYFVDRLAERIPFTGGLLLGHDFIRELYVHMGFHPAYKYREVHEVLFEKGRVVAECDRSQQMAEYRERLRSRPLRPDFGKAPEELSQWIEGCFSQRYTELGGE